MLTGSAHSSSGQAASGTAAASPFGKGLTFGIPASSSSAAVAPAPPSGGFGVAPFGTPAASGGFASPPTSGSEPFYPTYCCCS